MASESPWTVLSWNVHGSARPDVGALAAVIRSEEPDVVALQEIRKSHAAKLAAALGMRYSWALKHYPYTELMWWCAEGLAVMSPHALDAAGHTEVSVDQSMRNWRRRIAQWALVGRADRSMLMIYNVHLSPHHDQSGLRHDEALRVSEIVASIGDDPPAVVAGDFNDAGDPDIVASLPGCEPVVPTNTNPAEAPTQVLDHVLVPAEATDVTVTVPAGGDDWALISDHLPVTVRFRLPNTTTGV